MNFGHSLLKAFGTIGLILTLGVSMNANAGLFGIGGDSWKEEVMLHDGQKIIVERSQTYGGRHEIGQSAPIKKHTIRFSPPGSSQVITWTSEYAEDIGRTNFNLFAVHVMKGTAYVVAKPNLCLSYNKWGRPNPPYVFFKYDGSQWQRISLEQFPIEFKTLNVAIYLGGQEVKAMVSLGLVSAEKIKAMNSELKQPEYKTILREPVAKERINQMCEAMVYYKCGWFGTNPDGTFNKEFADRMCK